MTTSRCREVFAHLLMVFLRHAMILLSTRDATDNGRRRIEPNSTFWVFGFLLNGSGDLATGEYSGRSSPACRDPTPSPHLPGQPVDRSQLVARACVVGGFSTRSALATGDVCRVECSGRMVDRGCVIGGSSRRGSSVSDSLCVRRWGSSEATPVLVDPGVRIPVPDPPLVGDRASGTGSVPSPTHGRRYCVPRLSQPASLPSVPALPTDAAASPQGAASPPQVGSEDAMKRMPVDMEGGSPVTLSLRCQ
jgi:hypothetical protein